MKELSLIRVLGALLVCTTTSCAVEVYAQTAGDGAVTSTDPKLVDRTTDESDRTAYVGRLFKLRLTAAEQFLSAEQRGDADDAERLAGQVARLGAKLDLAFAAYVGEFDRSVSVGDNSTVTLAVDDPYTARGACAHRALSAALAGDGPTVAEKVAVCGGYLEDVVTGRRTSARAVIDAFLRAGKASSARASIAGGSTLLAASSAAPEQIRSGPCGGIEGAGLCAAVMLGLATAGYGVYSLADAARLDSSASDRVRAGEISERSYHNAVSSADAGRAIGWIALAVGSAAAVFCGSLLIGDGDASTEDGVSGAAVSFDARQVRVTW